MLRMLFLSLCQILLMQGGCILRRLVSSLLKLINASYSTTQLQSNFSQLPTNFFRKEISKIETTKTINFVSWRQNYTYGAIIFKKNIIIINKQFKQQCTKDEKFQIYSAIWTKENVLIYTTQTHIKYLLTNGDNGILKSLSNLFFLGSMKGKNLTGIELDFKIKKIEIDNSEYLFKKALLQKNGK